MPTELNELLSDERWIEVEVGSASFNIAYRPGSTSLRRQAEIQRQVRQMQAQDNVDEVEQTEQMGKLFCELVCDWDLVDGGKPLPLTPDVVAGRLPGSIFNAVMLAIGADGREEALEKKASSATSVATSSPKAKRAESHNGTRISEPLNTWA